MNQHHRVLTHIQPLISSLLLLTTTSHAYGRRLQTSAACLHSPTPGSHESATEAELCGVPTGGHEHLTHFLAHAGNCEPMTMILMTLPTVHIWSDCD